LNSHVGNSINYGYVMLVCCLVLWVQKGISRATCACLLYPNHHPAPRYLLLKALQRGTGHHVHFRNHPTQRHLSYFTNRHYLSLRKFSLLTRTKLSWHEGRGHSQLWFCRAIWVLFWPADKSFVSRARWRHKFNKARHYREVHGVSRLVNDWQSTRHDFKLVIPPKLVFSGWYLWASREWLVRQSLKCLIKFVLQVYSADVQGPIGYYPDFTIQPSCDCPACTPYDNCYTRPFIQELKQTWDRVPAPPYMTTLDVSLPSTEPSPLGTPELSDQSQSSQACQTIETKCHNCYSPDPLDPDNDAAWGLCPGTGEHLRQSFNLPPGPLNLDILPDSDDPYDKPPVRYEILVAVAIYGSEYKRLSLQAIYNVISEKYAYFRNPENVSWKVCSTVNLRVPG